MWSASSSTVISTASRTAWPWPMRSSSRPGQATTMSTPRRRPQTCGPWPTPPKTVRGAQAEALRERRHRRVDLGGQLTGRREDERAGPPRLRPLPARREPGEQRQHERDGLAGAGAAAAEHVATREGVGQRRGLDRGGDRDPAGGEDLDEGGGHAERAEVLGGQEGFLHGAWGRCDRRGRRRLGCSAGRGSGPRRRVAGAGPDAKASTSKKQGPRQKAGRCAQSR